MSERFELNDELLCAYMDGELDPEMRVRVEQANPLANLKVRDGALASLVTDEIAPLLMLPIGLALREVA